MKNLKIKGSIVITDPCYILPDNDREKNNQDWEICDNGHDMEKLIKTNNYICESTIYGDWECTCWAGSQASEYSEKDTAKIYGKFCADAGQVLVASLDDVLAYNPDFANWQKTHDWCATIIDDFDGEITYVEAMTDTGYKYCYIKGEGNKPFITSQTSL